MCIRDRLYADFVRGVPILVLLYFVYYGLPAIKVNLPSLLAAIVALTAFKSAQIIEITRGSFQSIPPLSFIHIQMCIRDRLLTAPRFACGTPRSEPCPSRR